MTHARDAIESSYTFCRQMSRRAGSSFYAGFLLLPREKRRAMDALYAFMRHTDDLADAPSPVDQRRDSLAAWRAALAQALRDEECEKSPIPPSALRPPPLLPALADTVRRFHIPVEHLTAVIDGVEMDLDRNRYETFDELQLYCERVASAVGLACIHIWGFRGPEAIEPARQAGIALQLTNILRDLKEDAEQGRVYLPLADLRECGYSVDDLQSGVTNEPFLRLMRLEIARAEQYYAGGAELLELLEPAGQRIFGLMMATYRELLRMISRNPSEVFRRHMRPNRFKKLQLAARWSLLPPRKVSLR